MHSTAIGDSHLKQEKPLTVRSKAKNLALGDDDTVEPKSPRIKPKSATTPRRKRANHKEVDTDQEEEVETEEKPSVEPQPQRKLRSSKRAKK